MKKVDEIYESTDYDKFTLLLGNRSVNDAHVKEIIELITTNGNLKIPIIVNEKYEIIDGQHRYFAWFHLKLPITFQIKPGLGLAEAQAMNYTNKNWTENDFLQSYIKHGIDAYVQYNKYKETFGLGHSVNIILLTGANDYRKQLHLFKSGDFKIKRLTEATHIAQMVMDFKDIYDGYKRRSFVLALRTLYKVNGYDHTQMLRKVQFQQTKLVHALDTVNYLEILIAIYNFKTEPNQRLLMMKESKIKYEVRKSA